MNQQIWLINSRNNYLFKGYNLIGKINLKVTHGFIGFEIVLFVALTTKR